MSGQGMITPGSVPISSSESGWISLNYQSLGSSTLQSIESDLQHLRERVRKIGSLERLENRVNNMEKVQKGVKDVEILEKRVSLTLTSNKLQIMQSNLEKLEKRIRDQEELNRKLADTVAAQGIAFMEEKALRMGKDVDMMKMEKDNESLRERVSYLEKELATVRAYCSDKGNADQMQHGGSMVENGGEMANLNEIARNTSHSHSNDCKVLSSTGKRQMLKRFTIKREVGVDVVLKTPKMEPIDDGHPQSVGNAAGDQTVQGGDSVVQAPDPVVTPPGWPGSALPYSTGNTQELSQNRYLNTNRHPLVIALIGETNQIASKPAKHADRNILAREHLYCKTSALIESTKQMFEGCQTACEICEEREKKIVHLNCASDLLNHVVSQHWNICLEVPQEAVHFWIDMCKVAR